ncbi:MAG: Ig-like domain-containing protein, partial [Longimicrobiales bacterium]
MNPGKRAAALCCVFIIVAFAGCKSDSSGPDAEFEVRPAEFDLQVGATRQLSAIGASGEVTWSSSNAAVATVISQTGFVTAVGRGEALISALSGSSVASARVTVTVPPTIALSAPTVDLDVTHGEPDPPTATVNVTNAGDGTLSNLAVGAP